MAARSWGSVTWDSSTINGNPAGNNQAEYKAALRRRASVKITGIVLRYPSNSLSPSSFPHRNWCAPPAAALSKSLPLAANHSTCAALSRIISSYGALHGILRGRIMRIGKNHGAQLRHGAPRSDIHQLERALFRPLKKLRQHRFVAGAGRKYFHVVPRTRKVPFKGYIVALILYIHQSFQQLLPAHALRPVAVIPPFSR